MSSKKNSNSQGPKTPNPKLKNQVLKQWSSQPTNQQSTPSKQQLITKNQKTTKTSMSQQPKSSTTPSTVQPQVLDQSQNSSPTNSQKQQSQQQAILHHSLSSEEEVFSSLGTSIRESSPSPEKTPYYTLKAIKDLLPLLMDQFNEATETLLSRVAGSKHTGKLLTQEAKATLESISPKVTDAINYVDSLEHSLRLRDEDLARAHEDLRAKEEIISLQEEKLNSLKLEAAKENPTQQGSLPPSKLKEPSTQTAEFKILESKLSALSEEVAHISRNLTTQPGTLHSGPTIPTVQGLQEPPSLSDHGVVIISPAKNDPSWSSNTKTILNKIDFQDKGVSIRDSRKGLILIKSTESSSTSKIKDLLSKHQNITKNSNLYCKGPLLTSIVVKSLPSSTSSEAIRNSLSQIGSSHSIFGKTYKYLKSDSFTQVIHLETELAKNLLASPRPLLRVGHCTHPVELFVPFTRCRRCQALDHSTIDCRCEALCGICARPGHLSEACKFRDSVENHYCVNCHDFNEFHPPEEQLDPYHTTSAKTCQSFKIYINTQISNKRQQLFNGNNNFNNY